MMNDIEYVALAVIGALLLFGACYFFGWI